MSIHNKTVLIVEDELELREILLFDFLNQGWGVLFALTLPEIENLLKESSVVLMDWMLPGIDSKALYESCKRHRPCLVFSGNPDCPIDGFLAKPFGLNQVVGSCEQAVKRAKSSEEVYIGDRVTSRISPEWGLGEVIDIQDSTYWIRFENVGSSAKSSDLTKVLKEHLIKPAELI